MVCGEQDVHASMRRRLPVSGETRDGWQYTVFLAVSRKRIRDQEEEDKGYGVTTGFVAL